jgi:hypothetical protein
MIEFPVLLFGYGLEGILEPRVSVLAERMVGMAPAFSTITG